MVVNLFCSPSKSCFGFWGYILLPTLTLLGLSFISAVKHLPTATESHDKNTPISNLIQFEFDAALTYGGSFNNTKIFVLIGSFSLLLFWFLFGSLWLQWKLIKHARDSGPNNFLLPGNKIDFLLFRLCVFATLVFGFFIYTIIALSIDRNHNSNVSSTRMIRSPPDSPQFSGGKKLSFEDDSSDTEFHYDLKKGVPVLNALRDPLFSCLQCWTQILGMWSVFFIADLLLRAQMPSVSNNVGPSDSDSQSNGSTSSGSSSLGPVKNRFRSLWFLRIALIKFTVLTVLYTLPSLMRGPFLQGSDIYKDDKLKTLELFSSVRRSLKSGLHNDHSLNLSEQGLQLFCGLNKLLSDLEPVFTNFIFMWVFATLACAIQHWHTCRSAKLLNGLLVSDSPEYSGDVALRGAYEDLLRDNRGASDTSRSNNQSRLRRRWDSFLPIISSGQAQRLRRRNSSNSRQGGIGRAHQRNADNGLDNDNTLTFWGKLWKRIKTDTIRCFMSSEIDNSWCNDIEGLTESDRDRNPTLAERSEASIARLEEIISWCFSRGLLLIIFFKWALFMNDEYIIGILKEPALNLDIYMEKIYGNLNPSADEIDSSVPQLYRTAIMNPTFLMVVRVLHYLLLFSLPVTPYLLRLVSRIHSDIVFRGCLLLVLHEVSAAVFRTHFGKDSFITKPCAFLIRCMNRFLGLLLLVITCTLFMQGFLIGCAEKCDSIERHVMEAQNAAANGFDICLMPLLWIFIGGHMLVFSV